MFCRWRATVCSLITSAAAIVRLLCPSATRRRTSSSRGVRPWPARRHVARQRLDAGRVGRGAQPREHVARRLELERRGVVVAQRAARQADQHAGAARCRRAPRGAASLARPPRRAERGARVAFRQGDRRAGVRGERVQGASDGPSASRSSSPAAPRAASASPTASMISTHAGSSAARAGRSRASPSARRMAAAAAAPSPCARRSSARPGWGSHPSPARVAVRRLGGRRVAPQPVQLAAPVVRAAGRELVRRAVREPLAGAPRLGQRVAPGALQLHDLGAVHEAHAGVGHHVRLPGAPLRQRGGPLARAAQLEHAAGRTRSCCSTRAR